MNNEHKQNRELEPFLQINGVEFALQEQTDSDIVYHTIKATMVAGHAIDVMLVYSPGEGWHIGLLLNKEAFAFFEGSFKASEEAVSLAQTFLASADNIHNLMKIRGQAGDGKILMINVEKVKNPLARKQGIRKFWQH